MTMGNNTWETSPWQQAAFASHALLIGTWTIPEISEAPLPEKYNTHLRQPEY